MKRLVLLLWVVCSASSCVFAQTHEWKLVWSDEFNTPGPPDSRNWNFETGFVRNHENQWYQPQNASCRNGLLIIQGRREKHPNPAYQPGSSNWKTSRPFADYTSASLTTRGLHEWRYGRFEMRARIDTRPGLWPAFWALGVAAPWPSNGEVDIMEYYRNMLLANVAWAAPQSSKPVWRSVKKPLAAFADPGWSHRFHIWRMDWNPDSIQLYVDDALMNTVRLADTTNGGANQTNPFHQPEYLILNLAIGGDNGGDPSDTAFPADFEIDYVRVYQKPS